MEQTSSITNLNPATWPARRVIPMMLVMFFVVIAILDGFFVILALRSNPGVVTDQAYEKGLAYNQTIAAADQQRTSGMQDRAAYEDGVLRWQLQDAAGAPVRAAQVMARMIRPTHEGVDFEVRLTERAPGVYESPITAPVSGSWTAKLEATWAQTKSHYASLKLIVP